MNLNIIITVFLVMILIAVYNLPNHVYKLLEERYKGKTNRQLQIESYFKQISNDKQEELLANWTDFLTDMKNTTEKYTVKDKESEELTRKLLHDTIVYGSEKTVKYLGGFKSCTNEDFVNQKHVVYMACIVCSLKYDFTGYESKPLDILKISIKDFSDYKKLYEKDLEEIQNEMD